MIRKILACVLGAFLGGLFNMSLITISNWAYPLPEGVDPNDLDALAAHVKANGMATGALIIVLVAHAGGSLVSGLVCGMIAMRSWYVAAISLGFFWTLGGIMMLTILPSPIWFAVTDLLLYVPAAVLGVMLGGRLTGRCSQHSTASDPIVTP